MQSPPASGTGTPASTLLQPRLLRLLVTWRSWWRREVLGTVDRADVIARRRTESALTGRYLLFITMSAGISILGLLLSSPAVVIGAMLLSPLMDPIMGVGFALAVGDQRWLRQSVLTLAVGVVFAILFCALIVLASPLQTVTSEIAARTRPNLFDLLVAIFSAIAGAYAMIRGREGAIVGVAIATALMPPLAVVGFGLATSNWPVFSGALLLFVTNLTAIALVATTMARLYGFSSHLTGKATRMQTLLILGALAGLSVPLGLSLVQIGWETNATRQMRQVLGEVYGGNAQISELVPSFGAEPLRITATVLTPTIIADAEQRAVAELRRTLGVPVEVRLTQVRVGEGTPVAGAAQLASARERAMAEADEAEELAARLALLAGVPPEEVTIDRNRRRALVSARPLEGATLATYAELERRIAAAAPDWDIRLRPPLAGLPSISFEGDAPDEAGRRALALAGWAQRRTGVALRAEGPGEAVALVAEALGEQGASVAPRAIGRGFGPVAIDWGIEQEVER